MARRDCLLLLQGPSTGSVGGARVLSCPQLLESVPQSWTRVAPSSTPQEHISTSVTSTHTRHALSFNLNISQIDLPLLRR